MPTEIATPEQRTTTLLEDSFVKPFYLSLLNGNFTEEGLRLATKIADAAQAISDLQIERLLAEPDWRPRLCAAWFIGLSRRTHFVTRVGDLLARDSTYASQAYCVALGLIATEECARFLHSYLETGGNDDQRWAIGALIHIQGAPSAAFVDHYGNPSTGVEIFSGIIDFLRQHRIIGRADSSEDIESRFFRVEKPQGIDVDPPGIFEIPDKPAERNPSKEYLGLLTHHDGELELEYVPGEKSMEELLAERNAHHVLRPLQRTKSRLLDIEAICREIYAETRSHYAELAPDLGSAALGFRILYGPPVVRAPYMFLGFQPGGRQDESNEGQHDSWPDQSWYASSKSPLARQLRHVFRIETVEHTGLNMVFFRAPDLGAWDGVQPDLKRELERFSLERVKRVVAALRPRHLVVIGLRTFKQLTHRDGYTVLSGQRGNRLAVRGEFGGCPTSGIVHLSGTRVSRQDRELLKEFFNPPISS